MGTSTCFQNTRQEIFALECFDKDQWGVEDHLLTVGNNEERKRCLDKNRTGESRKKNKRNRPG